jgi:hypothetical protein
MDTKTPLPDDLSILPSNVFDEAVDARERRLTTLFRRWPGLTKGELASLRGLYAERIRLAKLVGRRRELQ